MHPVFAGTLYIFSLSLLFGVLLKTLGLLQSISVGLLSGIVVFVISTVLVRLRNNAKLSHAIALAYAHSYLGFLIEKDKTIFLWITSKEIYGTLFALFIAPIPLVIIALFVALIVKPPRKTGSLK